MGLGGLGLVATTLDRFGKGHVFSEAIIALVFLGSPAGRGGRRGWKGIPIFLHVFLPDPSVTTALSLVLLPSFRPTPTLQGGKRGG